MAYVDADEAHHTRCLRLLRSHRGPLFVPTLVVSEVAHLLQRAGGLVGEIGLVHDLLEGTLELMPVEREDLARSAELTWQYRDLGLGMVDASVVALAERLKITQIATLDHRHFSVVKPVHCEAFELLP